ncbi:hydrogenase nickel incorporation protein HypB [Oscillospiraceae bacterium HV4-5-C5C]|nr:hydrogenase nickel incorporation protein HypB [Oscillospiraceae bacterium HV4-5-C5C]
MCKTDHNHLEDIDLDCLVQEEDLRHSDRLKAAFRAAGVRGIGLLGSPGSGKTTLLEHLVPELMKKRRVAVIEGDLATDNDARRIQAAGAPAVELNTDGACHLDASMVETAFAELPEPKPELLLIENVGNLVCPVDFPVGEEIRLAVISAAEGEDKPLKYPAAVLRTEGVIITKTDLAPYVRVNPDKMVAYVRDMNPHSRVFLAHMDAAGKLVTEAADGGCSLEDWLLG